MHWNTHDRMSGMMRPGADPNVIYRVNRALDNPDPWAIKFNQSMKNSGYGHTFDVPGLIKYPQSANPRLDERNDDWLYVWRKRRDVRSCCKPPHASPCSFPASSRAIPFLVSTLKLDSMSFIHLPSNPMPLNILPLV
jgi:hypothetical protein